MTTRLFPSVIFGVFLAISVSTPASAGVIGTGSDDNNEHQSIVGNDTPDITTSGVIGTGNDDENSGSGVIGTGNEDENNSEGVIGSGHQGEWMPGWLVHFLHGISITP